MSALATLLPRPGPVWGAQPQRPAQDTAPPWRGPAWGGAQARLRRVATAAAAQAAHWQALDAPAQAAALQALRQRLRRQGLRPESTADALGAVAACAAATLGWTPRPGQLLAAAALLDNRMAEMATGEGKTLAIALAAAVAALAGVPVHVVTANDYLAARDAAGLAPLYAALGLRASALPAGGDDAARRQAYGHDILYATAKALAFDYLRDRHAQARTHDFERAAAALCGRAAPPPLMRGLCMALLDEADSILLDEAEVPLILSQGVPQAARRAFLWQALALARQLEPGRDFRPLPAERSAVLEPAGEDRLAALAHGLGGPWQRPRYRREAVQLALAALHACRRNLDYLVRDGAIELLDEVTGRVATGRVWSRGLHTLVALKEGLNPPPDTETVAQITFQRFFQRYWRLCGISGTLWEARAELHQVYGASVLRVPLHRPCQRVTLPPRVWDGADAMFEAAALRVAALQSAGRPVLVGTDSVADSQALSDCLTRQGIAHRVLNALHDADEAAIVAAAGLAGRVTVATRMAGRGTDIALDEAARAAGGLHVLSCQHNPSRRLDRQLAGRAARQGDPGSAEAWTLGRGTPQGLGPGVDNLRPGSSSSTKHPPPWIIKMSQRWRQRLEERRRAAARAQLLEQDRHWERRLSFAGPSD